MSLLQHAVYEYWNTGLLFSTGSSSLDVLPDQSQQSTEQTDLFQLYVYCSFTPRMVKDCSSVLFLLKRHSTGLLTNEQSRKFCRYVMAQGVQTATLY